MFFTSLQPTFGKVARKLALAKIEQLAAAKSPAKVATRKPNLFGRISEVTIAAMGLTMLVPISALAFAAGLPSIILGAGIVAGLFGAAVLFAEERAIRS